MIKLLSKVDITFKLATKCVKTYKIFTINFIDDKENIPILIYFIFSNIWIQNHILTLWLRLMQGPQHLNIDM